MSPTELPELLYDTLSAGQRFKDTVLPVSPEMVRNYGRSVHNDALVAQADAKPGTPLGDPSLMILFGITRRVLGQDGRCPPGGILATQEFTMHRPLRLSETIRTHTSIAEKYEKRGKRYVLLRCDLVDQAGAPVGRVDSHVIWAR